MTQTQQTDFSKESHFSLKQCSWGRSFSDRHSQVHWSRDSTVGRHTEPLYQRESSVLEAPAPGTAGLTTMMNDPLAMNDDSVIMDSTVSSTERSCDSVGRANSSPQDSNLILPPVSGIEKMDQDCEDSLCKKLRNRLKSLKYLINHIEINYSKEKKYLKEKYNYIFNKYINMRKLDLDQSNQFALVILIKKDGSYDEDDWENIPNSTEKCPKMYYPDKSKHSEDYIFDLLNEIHSKSDCLYKKVLVFSFYSLCIARPNKESCNDRAIDIAKKLYEKHGIIMIIGFYEPWGINGSYKKILPCKPLEVCTYTFESQTYGRNDITVSSKNNEKKKKTEKKAQLIELELIDPIYNKLIPEIQNKPFLMDNTRKPSKRPVYNLNTISSKIYNPKNIEKLKNIVQTLFTRQHLCKTFAEYKKHSLEIFEKCMKEIYDLLICDYGSNLSGEEYYANINKEIYKYLQGVFFPWWAEKVEEASSALLLEETDQLLRTSAVSHFLIKCNRHYFVTGYVKKI